MSYMYKFKRNIKKYLHCIQRFFTNTSSHEIDALYRLLYLTVHDKEQALSLATAQTKNTFAHQWEKLPEGNGLLTDQWFRDNVSRILCEEELQIDKSWFVDKEVLDAGCGNGRWSYGLAALGAHITAVDINQVALEKTEESLKPFSIRKKFIHTPLEDLCGHLKGKKFDLVFSWGVVHHCGSFNRALEQLTQCVKDGGILYLYLYGRESVNFKEDLTYFKERLLYNTLLTDEDKLNFLLKKAKGNRAKLHIMHDIYAPLINRRLEFDDVKNFLECKGLHTVTRTIDHTELFIRAFKGDSQSVENRVLAKKKKPYWFERYV